jgi:hypothetical protein
VRPGYQLSAVPLVEARFALTSWLSGFIALGADIRLLGKRYLAEEVRVEQTAVIIEPWPVRPVCLAGALVRLF